MSEYAALSTAAQRLCDVTTREHLAAVPADSNSDVLQQAHDCIVRLTGIARHARAEADAGHAEPIEESDFEEAMNNANITAQHVQFSMFSHSLYQLFTKPLSKLTDEEIDLKRETIENASRLADIDTELSVQRDSINERKEKIADLTKEWDEVFAEFENRSKNVTSNESDEENPFKDQMKLVGKMETLRDILIRLIPTKTSYDFVEDKENLLEVLGTLREPFTMESVLSNISLGQ